MNTLHGRSLPENPARIPARKTIEKALKSPAQPKWERKLTAWYGRLVTLTRQISKTEEEMDDLRWEFAELIQLLSQAPTLLSPHGQPSSRSSISLREEQSILQRQADLGANIVTVTPGASSSCSVRIDGRAEVPLTPLLTKLLTVLMSNCGPSKDHLVGWKEVEKLSTAMTKLTGKEFKPHTLTQLISRLRRKLTQHGENRYLVQSNPELGYRLALRRQSSLVTARDHR